MPAYDDDHATAHAVLMDEAARLVALRTRVREAYGPAPAARGVARLGQPVRPARADAGAGGAVAMPPPPPTRQPLPAVPSEEALDRRWDRLRAALRLRIGEGAMPG